MDGMDGMDGMAIRPGSKPRFRLSQRAMRTNGKKNEGNQMEDGFLCFFVSFSVQVSKSTVYNVMFMFMFKLFLNPLFHECSSFLNLQKL